MEEKDWTALGYIMAAYSTMTQAHKRHFLKSCYMPCISSCNMPEDEKTWDAIDYSLC